LSGFTVGNDKDCWEWQAGCYKDGMAALILKDKKKEPLKLIDIRMNTLLTHSSRYVRHAQVRQP